VVYPREYTQWAQQQGIPVEDALHITFPADGDVFVIDPRLDRRYQTVQLTAGGQGVHWSVDGQPAPEGEWALQPGRHRIRAQTSQGACEEVRILVKP